MWVDYIQNINVWLSRMTESYSKLMLADIDPLPSRKCPLSTIPRPCACERKRHISPAFPSPISMIRSPLTVIFENSRFLKEGVFCMCHPKTFCESSIWYFGWNPTDSIKFDHLQELFEADQVQRFRISFELLFASYKWIFKIHARV